MRSLLLGLVLFTAGCAGHLSNPTPGDWVEVRSKHFTVRAESDADSVRETVTELERFYAAFDQVAYPHDPKPDFSIDVVLFDDETSLRELGHESGGLMQQRTGPDLEDHLTLVTHGTFTAASDPREHTRFLHELAHRFTAFHFPGAPIWLEEGFSELFSTMEIEGNTVILGKYLPGFVFVSEPWGVSDGWTPRVRIPIAEVPSIDELRHYSKATFYGAEVSNDPEDMARQQVKQLNYAAAWNLVHLLMLGEDATRNYFINYLEALARGSSTPEEAWLKHFGPPDSKLERRYRALLYATDRNVARIPFEPASAGKMTDRALSPAEVHLLWASVRNSRVEDQPERELEDIRTAIALEPNLVPARVALVMEYLASNDLTAAATELRRVERLAPADPSVLRAGLVLALDENNTASADRLAKKLIPVARTAGAHALLSEYLVQRGKPIAAIRAARAGLEIDPGSWACFASIAAAHEARGDYRTASEYVGMALNMLGENDPRRTRLLERLGKLEKRAATQN